MSQTIALYATDTMADWEYGYFVAGVTMASQFDPDRYDLVVVGDGAAEVRTAGRLRIRTDADVSDLAVDEVAAMILPGGDTYDRGHDAALGLAGTLLDRGTPVGAICGATLGLARAGLLNDRAHTSNAPEFLSGTVGYNGADRYLEKRVAVDGPLVTAPGTAPLEFTRAMFGQLTLFPPDVIDAWYGLYTTGEKKYYDILTAAS